jgi:RHS repeat-associated protein
LVTRADATVLDERRYEPYGAPIDSFRELPDGTTPIGAVDFTVDAHNALNKQTDPGTGLSDHGARWMAPDTGRWQTPDPPVKAPDPGFMERPWDLHPYQYVSQNPVLYWDPDGRDKNGVSGASADILRNRSGLDWGYKLSPSAKATLGPIFQRAWGFDVSKVRFAFGPTNGAAAFTVENLVILDRDAWDAATPDERLGLLGHEMTHSVQYERLRGTGTIGTVARVLRGPQLPGVLGKAQGLVFGFSAGVLGELVLKGADNSAFFKRYSREFGPASNYVPPDDLLATPIEKVNPVDSRYTLDQIAERTKEEVLSTLKGP